jgi:hypothetical protein
MGRTEGDCVSAGLVVSHPSDVESRCILVRIACEKQIQLKIYSGW